MLNLFKDKKLGVAEARRYDLPLHKSEGTGFLILLITLMTFLAMIALASTFVLDAVADRWASGLENRVTIELSAQAENGQLRSFSEIKEQSKLVKDILSEKNFIATADILEREEITALISPWLGHDIVEQDIPLPGIISVELAEGTSQTSEDVAALEEQLKERFSNIRLDRHQDWLNDLLTMTSLLQASAFLILVLIGITTITAIAGAIKSRIAVHKKDVELLHLMGAHDSYITRQFQRHALILSLQGALIGSLAALIVIYVLDAFYAHASDIFLPDFTFGAAHIGGFTVLPVLICAIGAMTARYTVLRALSDMP